MTHLGEERRLSDRIARWFEVILLAMSTGMLGMVVYFYGDMPKRIEALTQAVERTNLTLSYVQADVSELKDAARVSQAWRDRQLQLEGKVDRHTEQINALNKDVNELQKPLPWMRGK